MTPSGRSTLPTPVPVAKSQVNPTTKSPIAECGNPRNPPGFPDSGHQGTETSGGCIVAQERRPYVLVIEDDADLRRILRLHLTADGFAVTEAEDVAAAFAHLQSELPDCVILDLIMPGMDGFVFLKRLRSVERTCDVPVVILTASENYRDRAKGRQYQANVYLRKPCDLDQLTVALKQLCRNVGATEPDALA